MAHNHARWKVGVIGLGKMGSVRKGTVHEDDRLTVTFILIGKFDVPCLYLLHTIDLNFR